MKHFFIRLTCFLVIVIVLLSGLDLLISNRLRNTTDQRFVVWNDIIEGNINADILIMGSSRGFQHFSPLILDSILHINSYNISTDACTFNRQVERYNLYQIYNKKPSVIIQNIDYYSVFGSYTIGYEREQFFPFFYNKNCQMCFKEPFKWYEYLPMARYYGYDKLLKGTFVSGFLNTDILYKGYCGVERTWDGTELSKIQSLRVNIDEYTKELFCNFTAQVKKDSIQLIYVYAPLYIEGLNKVENLERAYEVFDSIANIYEVPILDYTYSNISYDTTYFWNATHLNKQGAELFTTMLANDLDSLGIVH